MCKTRTLTVLTAREEHWCKATQDVARTSLDKSKQVGCVIVQGNPFGQIRVASSCNRVPTRIGFKSHMLDRPNKYTYMEHAERAAIYRAAKMGCNTQYATMYVNWFPCVECSRAIISSGIARLVCVEPDWGNSKYDFNSSAKLLAETAVIVDYTDQMSIIDVSN